jgi:hypothetical protein
MIYMELHEAQLFRILSTFFGEDRVVLHMSAYAVCGGDIPEEQVWFEGWARQRRCLFTIVDADDHPRLVIDFSTSFAEAVDLRELEEHERLQLLFQALGIQYVLVTKDELADMLDPGSNLSLVSFLQDKYYNED